jgi:tricorn protease
MGELGYYLHPTIHRDRVVFVAEDDLWSVDASGGSAHRLTANPGTVAYPRFSPDGTYVAFSSRDEGHLEAHVMPSAGGPARRLTFFGGLAHVVGWAPDGGAAIVATDWKQPFAGQFALHEVPMDGSPARRIKVGPARAISHQPGGPGVVIGRNSFDPARWKRYRGGRTGTLWIDRAGSGDFAPLIELEGNMADPMWIGRRIYFLSDHEGTGNLYSCTPTGRGLQRHTEHENFYARFPASDGKRIVYHAGADLYVFDGDTQTKIDVRVPSARPQRNRRFISPGRFVESFDLDPKGQAVAIVARGGAATMDLWEGAPLRHGEVSSSRYRLAAWLPDRRRIVAITDESGEEELVVFDSGGGQAGQRIGGDIGRPRSLDPAPAGTDRVALTNHRFEVVLVDLNAGISTVIHRSPHSWIQGTDWSPDGRWIAFSAAVSRNTIALHLYDTETRRTHRITRPDFADVRPSFDPEGRFLHFIGHRVFDPVPDAFFHDYSFPKGTRPFLIPLATDTPSPFSPTQRLPRPPGTPPGPQSAANDKESDAPVPVQIDLEGIEDRVVAYPVPEGSYRAVFGARGRSFLLSAPIQGRLAPQPMVSTGPAGRLEAYDFQQHKVEVIADDVSSVSISMDGKIMAIRAGNRIRVVPAAFKDDASKNDEPGRDSGWLDLDRIRLEVDPGGEWAQMFREAWRLQREHFWTQDMSAVDWEHIYDRYRPLVERVASRAEFSDLMWEMQGELGTSHAYELGGDYRPEPKYLLGSLGANFERTARGSWRIGAIPHGDSWDERAWSPLQAPGVDVVVDDRILSIDGKDLGLARAPEEALVDRAGRDVRLVVRRGRRQPRTVTVRALESETPLRYRDWVETNRRRVAEASEGRAGYIHLPDMGANGFAEFHRSWLSQVDHEGLVIDVRFNRGGNVSHLLLEKLLRRRIGYRVTRWTEPYAIPADAPAGPMVALTNEYAGSDGDIFSHAFKMHGLGPLIGTRTWGGVIGIWPQQSLVDGTITTQPEFSNWFEDVGWDVENYGTDPDIRVTISPQDHAAGRDPQLERGIAELIRIINERPPSPPAFGDPPKKTPPRLS